MLCWGQEGRTPGLGGGLLLPCPEPGAGVGVRGAGLSCEVPVSRTRPPGCLGCAHVCMHVHGCARVCIAGTQGPAAPPCARAPAPWDPVQPSPAPLPLGLHAVCPPVLPLWPPSKQAAHPHGGRGGAVTLAPRAPMLVRGPCWDPRAGEGGSVQKPRPQCRAPPRGRGGLHPPEAADSRCRHGLHLPLPVTHSCAAPAAPLPPLPSRGTPQPAAAPRR